jgi:hypothetical protein
MADISDFGSHDVTRFYTIKERHSHYESSEYGVDPVHSL